MTDKSRKKEEVPETEEVMEEVQVDPLAEANAKAEEYLDMASRIQADFDNFRKRAQKEKEEYRAFATADLMGDLLSIVDDFDRALEHADPESDIAIGVNGIRKNLMKVLESKGLKEIDASGKFDPNYHEALCTVEAETEGDVAEVFQKGYCIGNRVLRYTKVKVTKKKENTNTGVGE